ncbi:MAG: hypothetical protein J6K37_05940 [Lachnospiraceae bacterium]|nr:hypothetical protein [Lachnospiraceae bacterium]
MTNELQLLIEALEKKKDVLSNILAKSEEQKELVGAPKLDMEQFDRLVDDKTDLLTQMEQIDQGFDMVYHRVKDELVANKQSYKTEIERLQQLIKDTLDLGAQIHATEVRTKDSMSNVLLASRQELVKKRVTSKSVMDYYKANSQMSVMDPYFIDKKK